MDASALAAFAAVAFLAVAHLFAAKLRYLGGIPRSRALSIAGGISVAYVFVHLLPELSERQQVLTETTEGALPFLERHAYLVALLGLALFYGIERSARRSRIAARTARGEDRASDRVFWLSMVSFAVYNGLIGYVLVERSEEDAESFVFFAIAVGVHFVVNDYGLREHHKDAYTRVGRWLLAASLFAGWALGVAAAVSEAALALLVAFLAGGIVLNVLKEELPEDRESRFWPFAAGAAAYAALLLAA